MTWQRHDWFLFYEHTSCTAGAPALMLLTDTPHEGSISEAAHLRIFPGLRCQGSSCNRCCSQTRGTKARFRRQLIFGSFPGFAASNTGRHTPVPATENPSMMAGTRLIVASTHRHGATPVHASGSGPASWAFWQTRQSGYGLEVSPLGFT